MKSKTRTTQGVIAVVLALSAVSSLTSCSAASNGADFTTVNAADRLVDIESLGEEQYRGTYGSTGGPGGPLPTLLVYVECDCTNSALAARFSQGGFAAAGQDRWTKTIDKVSVYAGVRDLKAPTSFPDGKGNTVPVEKDGVLISYTRAG